VICTTETRSWGWVLGLTARSDHLHARAVARSVCQAPVTSQKWSVQGLRKRDIHGIVSGQVSSEVPDARHQEVVRIPGEREAREVIERRTAAPSLHFTGERVAAQNLRYFHVHQVRHMQGFLGLQQAFFQRDTGRHSQEDFQDYGRVENDHRLSRSARTARTGDIDGVTAERPCSLARNSSTDGRSAMRRISCNK